ncbi:hypothetical protein AB0B95_30780 [Streptomyces hygroscopicus]|uniref:hypothetical protein n=1 Tax=Streptomyces hygroscopicus TaxID=1912 RepID=UPI00157C3EF0|nr:hypothetical protein [Streptomyces hygroscopicus]
MIALLAAKAPRLDRALKKIARGGGEVVLLDGALIRTRRHTGKTNRKTTAASTSPTQPPTNSTTIHDPCHARTLTSTFKLAAAPWAPLTGWRRLPYRACVHEYR